MLHFMMDAYDTSEASTNDLMSVNSFLVRTASELQLKAVMPPFLVPYYYSSEMKDGGISAFMLLEGGHITIHTFPFRSCYFVDIAFNEFFSVSEAQETILGMFSAKTVRTYSADRRFIGELPDAPIDTAVDFGPHYMITVRDTEMTLDSIYRWLDEIAPKINMDAITRPYVVYSTVNDPAYISGMLVVAQSHIAVHYSIAERLAYIDIFSCSFLDADQIDRVLTESFGNNYTYKLYVRGSKHEYAYQNTDSLNSAFKQWQSDKN